MPTLTNPRTNATIESHLSHADVAGMLSENLPANHWLWFFLHREMLDRTGGATDVAAAIRRLAHVLLVPIGYGLKRPMLRLSHRLEGFGAQRFKVYLSRRRTICIKTGLLREDTNAPMGDEYYLGCLVGGKFLPGSVAYGSREKITLNPCERSFLDGLFEDTAGFLAEAGRDMNRCSYCGRQLEDERSKVVGYGAICAKSWGLPWGTRDGQHSASFASEYDETAADLCDAVIDDPADDGTWAVLGDWFEDHGLRRPVAPGRGVVVPRIDFDD